jgi:hypothetical protein
MKRIEMTEQEVEQMVDHMLAMGKLNRSRMGYKDDNFLPVANVIGPNHEQAIVPLRFSDDREKYAMMQALSVAARKEGAAAIAIVSDVCFTRSDRFCKHFGLADPGVSDLAELQRAYLRILRDDYGGEVKNLPRELWGEAICVAIKGPLIPAKSKMAYYREGEGDTVEWFDEEKRGGIAEADFNLLPDWWDDGRPN